MNGTGLMTLAEAAGVGADRIGGKAAVLARLLTAGFPVPPGFVITEDAFARAVQDLDGAIAVAAAGLGGAGLFAVRSSAAAEDLADASYAGLYETFLNVPAAGLAAAVRRCRAAAEAPRVSTYQQHRTAAAGAGLGMAVLVQPIIPADTAGVAFTADPVTGDRDLIVITAVRGLGDRLVDGQAAGDQWTVHADRIQHHRVTERTIDAEQAAEIADLARRVEAQTGVPQDIEWAYAGRHLWLLQARPMTALPDPVTWEPPGPGLWQRNFRLGEWLPEPVTPLFADWLLPYLDMGFADGMRATAGTAFEFPNAIINGWFYATPTPAITPNRLLRAVVSTRGHLLAFMFHTLVQPMRNPPAAGAGVLAALDRRWRERLLPEYVALIGDGQTRLWTTVPQHLTGLVEEIGRTAGVHLWYLAIVGGAAWKMESALARFARRHLPGVLPDGVAVLLSGLAGGTDDPPEHAVTSLDWYHRTVGELPTSATTGSPPQQQPAGRAAARQAAEHACRTALAGRRRLLRRFTALLAVTRRYASIREEQARALSLGWPLLRHTAKRLGDSLHSTGVIADADDVYFLTHAELTAALSADPPRLSDVVAARRAEWRRQRRLAAPLSLGPTPRFLSHVLAGAHARPPGTPENVIVGQAASPGRATGPVRVIHGPDEFDQLDAGDILVAPTTTPAWTILLARAAAVVSDGGTLAAHASLIAREYAIPAVVATGDATRRLSNGQIVTVDGTTGTVTPT